MSVKVKTAIHNPARVVLPIGISIALSLLGDLALFASLPMNVEVIGISVANLGLVFGIHRLIRIPGNPLGGMLMNHVNRRPIFLSGMLFAVLSTFGYSVANDLFFLILMRICWGIGWILLYISSMAMLIDITHKKNRGKWIGVYNTWYLIGIAGGSLLGGFLSDRIGFRNSMMICTALTTFGFLIAIFFLPESYCPLPKLIEKQKTEKPSFRKSLFMKISEFKNLVINTPGLLMVLLVYMVNQFAAEGVALSVLSILLKSRFDTGITFGLLVVGISSLNGFLLGFRYILSAIISPVAGEISDRVQHGRIYLMIAGIGLSIVSFLFIGYGKNLGGIIFGIVLNAIGGGGVFVSLSALLGDITPKNSEGKILGLYATAGDIGSALGPIFAYFLLTYFHVSNVFMVCAVLFAICLFFVLRNLRKVVDKTA